jgi:hypothetical protein
MIFLILFAYLAKKQYFCIVKQVSLRIACHNKAIKAEGCKTYGSTSVEPNFLSSVFDSSFRVSPSIVAAFHAAFFIHLPSSPSAAR